MVNVAYSGNARWFVVRTQPRRERLALEHLTRQGFATFCPMWRGAVRSRRETLRTLSPFFPSYVFARIDLATQLWRSINGTVGCVGLVSFGTRPTALPGGFVETLQERCAVDGELRFEQALEPGDHVRVVGGSFDNLCGTLLERSGGERVAILLEVMNRATRVELDFARLIAA